jgi:hypothetical protein
MPLRPGEHRCPRRGCDAVVPNHIFCCVTDWMLLSRGVQRGILRTKSLNLLSVTRRLAIQDAMVEWARLPKGNQLNA